MAGEAPELVLTEEASVEEPEAAAPSDLTRGLQDYRFQIADNTSIGGYAELHYNLTIPKDGETRGELDFHRMVVFVAHNFTDALRFYTEIEVEHVNEISLEQAFLDYELLDAALTLRAGLVLVPMGIINQWHEPPIFHGVERPNLDRVIIPSTWREGGAGVVGEPVEGLRYELYVVGGLNGAGFSAESGIRGGRQSVSNALTNGWAVTGRVEVEPVLGAIIGVSSYFGNPGANIESLSAPSGGDLDIAMRTVGLSADVRVRWSGIEARAVVAGFWIGDTADLRTAVGEGEETGPDVGSRLFGVYAEVAYDLLHALDTTHQILPFFRFETNDTLAALEGRSRTEADDARRVRDLVFGLSYRPIPQAVFKSDLILRQPGGSAEGTNLFSLGVGAMF